MFGTFSPVGSIPHCDLRERRYESRTTAERGIVRRGEPTQPYPVLGWVAPKPSSLGDLR